MKKILFGVFAGLILASVISISSCSKDDTAPPVVSITGTVGPISLNSSAVSDPGATATDEEDGAITAITSDWSWGTNPNPNVAATYTIYYSATDKAGNVGTATRSVVVRNDAYYLAGNYLVADTCGTIPYSYAQTITASTSVNNRIHFNKFADYTGNTGIYAEIAGTSITLPSQTANDIGTVVPPDDHQFNGTGSFITSPNIILHLNYTDYNITTTSTANCSAWFVKQ